MKICYSKKVSLKRYLIGRGIFEVVLFRKKLQEFLVVDILRRSVHFTQLRGFADS